MALLSSMEVLHGRRRRRATNSRFSLTRQRATQQAPNRQCTPLPDRMKDGCVVGIVSGAQVVPPGECDAFAEGLQLELSARIEEPLVRTKRSAGIANSPNVHQRTGLHGYDSVAVYVLACFPILQQIIAPQRRAPLAPVARADVAVHG